MRKIISVLLSIIILVCSLSVSSLCVSAEERSTVSVGTASSSGGNRIEIPVEISGNPGTAAFRFIVQYDEAILKLVDIEFGKAAEEFYTGTSEYFHSPYSVSGFNSEKNIYTDGQLFVLIFEISSSAEDGEYPILLSYDADDVFNIEEQNVAFDVVNGAAIVGDKCIHTLYEWQADSGMLVKNCSHCGMELKRLQFKDMNGLAVYGDYVEYTSSLNQFITGTNPPERTMFSPQTAITRAMFVTILYRMAGEPYKNANPYDVSPFTDIKDTSVYYYDAACWALDNEITNQITFKPYDNVSREQTASFLFRYAQANDMVTDEAYKSVNLSVYHDYNNIRDWSKEAMQWANYNGMITGTMQCYANPQGSTLRIHATKILYGFGKTCNIGNFE